MGRLKWDRAQEHNRVERWFKHEQGRAPVEDARPPKLLCVICEDHATRVIGSKAFCSVCAPEDAVPELPRLILNLAPDLSVAMELEAGEIRCEWSRARPMTLDEARRFRAAREELLGVKP